MALTPGTRLTHYEIVAPLGAGGMGEVWRASDTRLGREVAIKVLPEHFAEDEDRLRRFEREARTLATLNHPCVAQVYGIDQQDETCFMVMELVEGEDLATQLARGPLPLDEAVSVCRQIAEGLEAAHEAGVIHRDLKPANVRLTPDDAVKILDFGLAKPLPSRSGASGHGTTTAQRDSVLVTEEGLVLGTPTYMSPEQARGKPVDRRTDIWAFDSDATGRAEVYVVSTPGGAPVQISEDGGSAPRWSSSGERLYFRRGRTIWRVPMTANRPSGPAEQVFDAPRLDVDTAYAIAPDESRVLAVQLDESAIRDEIRIVTRFFERIEAIAGPGSR